MNESNESSYVVIVKGQQYSVWLNVSEAPAGWRTVGVEGTREECHYWIEHNWTDCCPAGSTEANAWR